MGVSSGGHRCGKAWRCGATWIVQDLPVVRKGQRARCCGVQQEEDREGAGDGAGIRHEAKEL